MQDGHPWALFHSPLSFPFSHPARGAADCLPSSYRLVKPRLQAFSLLSWQKRGKETHGKTEQRVMSELAGLSSDGPLAGA